MGRSQSEVGYVTLHRVAVHVVSGPSWRTILPSLKCQEDRLYSSTRFLPTTASGNDLLLVSVLCGILPSASFQDDVIFLSSFPSIFDRKYVSMREIRL